MDSLTNFKSTWLTHGGIHNLNCPTAVKEVEFLYKISRNKHYKSKKKKASLKNSRNQSLRKKRTSIEQKSLVKHRNKKEETGHLIGTQTRKYDSLDEQNTCLVFSRKRQRKPLPLPLSLWCHWNALGVASQVTTGEATYLLKLRITSMSGGKRA